MSIELSLPGCPMCGGSLEHACDRDAVVCRNVIRGVTAEGMVSGPCGYEIGGEELLNAHTKGLSPFAAEKVPIEMPKPEEPAGLDMHAEMEATVSAEGAAMLDETVNASHTGIFGRLVGAKLE